LVQSGRWSPFAPLFGRETHRLPYPSPTVRMAAPAPPPPDQKPPAVAGLRKKPTNEKKEDKGLEPDQILKSQTGQEYLVECKLGSGGFGEVWRVSLLDDPDKRFAMKTEKNMGTHKEMRRLKCEVNLFEEIEKAPNSIEKKHFVKMYGKGKTVAFKYYIMDLIWLSLKDLKQHICGDVFTPHTKIKIGRQTLKGIEAQHDIGYLHRDIKPANYAVGLPPKDCIIYLLDFGIARPYRDKDGVLRKARKRVRGLGTQLYMSMDCLCQNEQSRRDDLEVWMYMMVEFYDRTNLLWWNLEPNDAQMACNLREELMNKPKELLAEGRLKVPEKWCDIIEYLNGMQFEDCADFVQINLFLTQICVDENIDENQPFDWAGKKPKSPEKPKKEKKKKKEGEVRKKKTAEVKEPKDSKEHKEAKEDDKNHKPKGKGKSKSDSEIESNEGEDDYQAYLRWLVYFLKKKRKSRRRKTKQKSNEFSEKTRKKPLTEKKKEVVLDEHPKVAEAVVVPAKIVDSNEHLELHKGELVVANITPAKEKFVAPPPGPGQQPFKKKVDAHAGTPESNESNNEREEKKKFVPKKKKRGTGSQCSDANDDAKLEAFQRKKVGVLRKVGTNLNVTEKKQIRKVGTKRKSQVDDEKCPAVKPVVEPKKAEVKKK
ncbi:hypothetical protein PRIPAC_76434, partial [Pristionchus pacificus]